MARSVGSGFFSRHDEFAVNPNQTPTQVSASTRPALLGIWRLGREIHSGRTSELTLAQPADAEGSPRWDYVLKRAVDTTNNAENVRQIVQFAAASEKVSNPNLVPVLDASATGTSPYLVTPLIEGVTLQESLAGVAKPLPVALWITRQIAQALTALHATGWIHGDVKPENTIVGPRGHVTVIDLGFASQIHRVDSSQFRGTPEYAAPEVMKGNMAAMPAADVFSLGRILWKCLTHIELANDVVLAPVAQLVEEMVSEDPSSRPSAADVTERLLRLEIDTLGHHIGPSPSIHRGTGNVRRAA
ncbi:serine/threonine-protein kinase [Planctomycetes bacterium K23_9]|uniref:Serine/threonine-protein kinase PK-1 n=1 Tax=Stieleria marina TaxID=1930275 RepID=A0A517NQX1_9BACT|nr:Serine/threonine-protein kinase PK-1 [Planctomycetes bacterium K23_9]